MAFLSDTGLDQLVGLSDSLEILKTIHLLTKGFFVVAVVACFSKYDSALS